MSEAEVRRLMGFVRYTLSSFRDDSEWDDLLSVGYIALWQALQTWTPDAGYSLLSAIRTRARSAVLDYLRRERRARTTWMQIEPFFLGYDVEQLPLDAAPFELIPTRLEAHRIWQRLAQTASPKQRRYLYRRFHYGESLEEIAAACGVAKSTVRGSIELALERYRASVGLSTPQGDTVTRRREYHRDYARQRRAAKQQAAP